MSDFALITFLTDFGWGGGYVAACEATLASISPDARVMHVSHEVRVGDVQEGASVLARVAPLCPVAVHLAVVDPGVGTERRLIALKARRGDVLVGPDNGLLMPALEALGGALAVWVLDPARVRAQAGLPEERISFTFHGRDVFAPAAALLFSGLPAGKISTEADASALSVLAPRVTKIGPDEVCAEVVEVDRFGNVGLALPFDRFKPSHPNVEVEVVGEGLPSWSARLVRTYGDLAPGELGLYQDSWGQMGLTLNGASAAELLGVQRGMLIKMCEPTSLGDR